MIFENYLINMIFSLLSDDQKKEYLQFADKLNPALKKILFKVIEAKSIEDLIYAKKELFEYKERIENEMKKHINIKRKELFKLAEHESTNDSGQTDDEIMQKLIEDIKNIN